MRNRKDEGVCSVRANKTELAAVAPKNTMAEPILRVYSGMEESTPSLPGKILGILCILSGKAAVVGIGP